MLLNRAVAAGESVEITYTTTITEVLASYSNSATLTGAGLSQPSTITVANYNAGGTGTGLTPLPKVRIVKGDVNGNAADTSATAVTLSGSSVKLLFLVTNTGNEPLTKFLVSDVVVSNGTVTGFKCVYPKILLPKASFPCAATLEDVAPGVVHSDVATVTAVGYYSLKTVTSHNSYFAKRSAPPVPNRIDTGMAAQTEHRNVGEMAAGVGGIGMLLVFGAENLRRRVRQHR